MKNKKLEFWAATLLLLLCLVIIITSGGWQQRPDDAALHNVRSFMGIYFSFSYFFNLFIPSVIIPLGFYWGFISTNFYLIPRYFLQKKWDAFIGLSLINLLLLWLIFLLGDYWEVVFQVSHPGSASLWLNLVRRSMAPTFFFLLLMAAYMFIIYYLYPRFLIIKDQNLQLKKLGQQTAIFLLCWLMLVVFSLSVGHRWRHFMIFLSLSVVPFSFAYYLFNYFRLLPKLEKKEIKRFIFILFAFLSSLVLTLAGTIIFSAISDSRSYQFTPIFFTFWIILFLAGTPVIWLIYRQTSEEARLLTSLKTALTTSTANIDLLKSQINPHFLFNVLNTLYGMAIQENAERTSTGIQKLGDMMRFMLRENMLDSISLQREAAYLKDYIDLQKLRTQTLENIRITTNLNDQFYDHDIAPMLLIPFVENAFKHGISLRHPSWIHITLSCDETHLYFDVINSLQSKNENDPERLKSGIGLENIKQRLALYYPGRHELIIRQSTLEYFVHLTISFVYGTTNKKAG